MEFYRHNINISTECLVVEQLRDQFDDAYGMFVSSGYGVVEAQYSRTRLHPDDKYNKRIGRLVSKEKLKDLTFYVKFITIKKDKKILTICNKEETVQFELLKFNDSGKMRIY